MISIFFDLTHVLSLQSNTHFFLSFGMVGWSGVADGNTSFWSLSSFLSFAVLMTSNVHGDNSHSHSIDEKKKKSDV